MQFGNVRKRSGAKDFPPALPVTILGWYRHYRDSREERERERCAWRVVCVKQRAPGGTVPCMEEQCEHR